MVNVFERMPHRYHIEGASGQAWMWQRADEGIEAELSSNALDGNAGNVQSYGAPA
jgi:hypothetical protein